MIKQTIVFVVLVLIFKKLFDMLDQIRDNHRRKQQLLEMKILYARTERALLVRQAWGRHQMRKDRRRYYNEELVDGQPTVNIKFDRLHCWADGNGSIVAHYVERENEKS